MKLTKKALLAATPAFSGDFSSAHDVYVEFSVDGAKKYYHMDSEEENKDIFKKLDKQYKLLYAHYENGGYDGSAYVFGYDKKEDKFFEAHGSHCSCYGLEDQFQPEYCTPKELAELVKRRDEGEYHYEYRESGMSEWLKGVAAQ